MTTEEQKKSEGAALVEHITQEYEAARLGAQELAGTARHAFVRQCMEQRVKQPFNQLTTLVGQADAIALVADALRDRTQSSKQDALTDQHWGKEALEDFHDNRRRESA